MGLQELSCPGGGRKPPCPRWAGGQPWLLGCALLRLLAVAAATGAPTTAISCCWLAARPAPGTGVGGGCRRLR